jgi:hypothetical protein
MATTVALTSSSPSSPSGQPLTFTAKVSVQATGAPVPSGSVVFNAGAERIGQSPIDTQGEATVTTTKLAAGTYTVTASFTGGALLEPASGTLTEQVTEPLAVSLNPNVGPPGAVTMVSGSGFRPNATIQLSWRSDRDAAARTPPVTVVTDSAGQFGPVPLVMAEHELLGPQTLMVDTGSTATTGGSFLLVRPSSLTPFDAYRTDPNSLSLGAP